VQNQGRLLILAQENRLRAALSQHFAALGYQVLEAASLAEGLASPLASAPQLLLMSAHLDDMSALEALSTLRARPRFGGLPTIVLVGPEEAALQRDLLAAGADDVLIAPYDMDILTLRVRNALQRAEREDVTEPRTGLPTGRLLQERLAALTQGDDWYLLEITLEHFAAFRDLVGFVTAHEALRHAGHLISQLAAEIGGEGSFVGHLRGTETFVVLTSTACGPDLRAALAERLPPALHAFYSFTERDQGYIELEDGAGGTSRQPLMAVRLAVEQRSPAL
jgi:DNA-binding response OmpR family regulator